MIYTALTGIPFFGGVFMAFMIALKMQGDTGHPASLPTEPFMNLKDAKYSMSALSRVAAMLYILKAELGRPHTQRPTFNHLLGSANDSLLYIICYYPWPCGVSNWSKLRAMANCGRQSALAKSILT